MGVTIITLIEARVEEVSDTHTLARGTPLAAVAPKRIYSVEACIRPIPCWLRLTSKKRSPASTFRPWRPEPDTRLLTTRRTEMVLTYSFGLAERCVRPWTYN